jgi:exopolysaccharide biosynthesis protein
MMKRFGAFFVLSALLTPLAPQAAEAAPIASPPKVLASQVYNPLSVDKRKTRIWLPMRNVQVTKRQTTVTGFKMELSSNAVGPYSLERSVPYGALHHLRVQIFEKKTYIVADWRHATPMDINVRPDGIEIFFYHQKAAPSYRTVASGVKYWEGQRWTNAGPMRVRVLQLDPKKVKLDPVIATTGANKMGLASVSHLAKREGAIAAVNGGFYSPLTGEPQGALVLNRTLVSRTMMNRPSLWFENDGEAYIKVEKPYAAVRLDDGTMIGCQAVNERPRHNRITLYTAHYGGRTRTISDPSRWELAVDSQGMVVGEGHGNVAIPKGGYVLSGQGYGASALRKSIGMGQEIHMQYALSNPAVVDAIGGGPVLLHSGRYLPAPGYQKFQSDVTASRTSRTAFGITKDGKYMLVTVDGRKPGYSMGATLKEMAYTMKELGAVEAMNLDGGGSTTMWVKGKTVNRPSDGFERRVATALLVLPRDRQTANAWEQMLASGLKY